MNMNSKIFVLVLIAGLTSCTIENDLLLGEEENFKFIYCTPSIEDTVTYALFSKASTFLNQNPTYQDLIFEDAEVTLKNLTTNSLITTYEWTTVDQALDKNLPILKAVTDPALYHVGDVIQLEVNQGGKEVLKQEAIVPAKPALKEYAVTWETNIPSEYQGGGDEITQVSVTLDSIPFRYFRMEVLRPQSDGSMVKASPQLQRIDDAFFENEITDINPSATGPIRRFPSFFDHYWIYYVPEDYTGEIVLKGAYFDFLPTIRPLKIIISPLNYSVFQADLYTIISNEVTNVFAEPLPYPTNLNCDDCLGNFQIINPVEIYLE